MTNRGPIKMFLLADSFVGMLASVIEGFKSEVGGLLFGDWFRTPRKVTVQHAIPLQTTVRKPGEVHFHPRRTKRVSELWDDLSIYWPLGHFHSHPEYGGKKYYPEPSLQDEESMDKDELEVIVSVWKAKRREHLGYIRDGLRLSGAVGDYYVQIAAWYCNMKSRVEEVEIWCPYIDVINLAYELGIVSKWGRLFESDSVVSVSSLRKLKRRIEKHERQTIRYPYSKSPALRKIRRTLKRMKKEMQE